MGIKSSKTYYTTFDMVHDTEFVYRINIYSTRILFRVYHSIFVYYSDKKHTMAKTYVPEFAINAKKSHRNMLDWILRDVKKRKFAFSDLNVDGLVFPFKPDHSYDPEDAFYYGEG